MKTIKIPLTIKVLFIGLWQPWSLSERREGKSSAVPETLSAMATGNTRPLRSARLPGPNRLRFVSIQQAREKGKCEKRRMKGQKERGSSRNPTDVIRKACNIVQLSKKRQAPDTALATWTRSLRPPLACPLAIAASINNSV